jgi:hypothetical protein
MKLALKEVALTSSRPAKNEITNLTKTMGNEKIINIQKYKSMTRIIRRERNKKFKDLSVEVYDIPDMLAKNSRDERFLLFDSGVYDIDRIIIYLSPFQKKYIMASETWLIDGTFKSTPPSFYQLLTIHC